MKKLLKFLAIFIGTVFLILGIMGVFIPGVPTTPFLLLTAGLYLYGSESLYNKLLSHKYTGKYIVAYRNARGMTIQLKLYSIILMWCMILMSCFFFITEFWLKTVVLLLGLAGTVVMGFVVPTIKRNK
jgi:uncharacterized protein